MRIYCVYPIAKTGRWSLHVLTAIPGPWSWPLFLINMGSCIFKKATTKISQLNAKGNQLVNWESVFLNINYWSLPVRMNWQSLGKRRNKYNHTIWKYPVRSWGRAELWVKASNFPVKIPFMGLHSLSEKRQAGPAFILLLTAHWVQLRKSRRASDQSLREGTQRSGDVSSHLYKLQVVALEQEKESACLVQQSRSVRGEPVRAVSFQSSGCNVTKAKMVLSLPLENLIGVSI